MIVNEYIVKIIDNNKFKNFFQPYCDEHKKNSINLV